MRKNINPFWVVILLASLSPGFSYAATITWVNTSGGGWNVAANWSPAQVPTNTDTALITNSGTYTVTINSTAEANVLTLGSGTLGGAGSLVLAGPLNWGGGTILSNLVQFNGGSFSNSMILNGGEVINTGTLSWTATSIFVGNGSIISNASGGIINLTANLSEGFVGANRATFDNAGQLIVAVPSAATFFDTFTNTGSIAVNGGTLELGGGGTSSGSITAVSGATMEIANGAFSINSGTLSGAGNFAVAAGTVTVGVGLNLGGAWTFSGGTTTLSTTTVSANAVIISGGIVSFGGSGPWLPGTLTLSGGTLEGGTPVTVQDPNGMTWSGGTILSNLVQFNGGSFSNSMILNGGEVINTGTLNWTASSIAVGNGSIISNASGGIINLTANPSEGFVGANRATFDNAGQLIVAVPSTATFIDTFTNTGTITINSGILDLSSGHSLAGGTLNFGINALNNYGSNTLAGAAGLAGTLKSTFNGGYLPSVGNAYNIMTYGSSSGNFTATNLSPLAIWTVTQGATVLTITVVKLVPQVSVPAEVVFGNSTIGSTLKATATWNGTNVPGVFTYTPPAGTVLNIGLNQPLSVIFVPNDPSTFVSVTNNFLVSVIAAPSLAIKLSGTQDILTFPAIPSQNYQVLSTTNLLVAMTPLGAAISNANGTVNVTNNISARQTFYRLQIQPAP